MRGVHFANRRGFLTAAVASVSLFASRNLLSIEPIDVIYKRRESDGGRRHEYTVKLLDLALSKYGASYRPRPSRFILPQTRALLELKRDQNVSVVASMTSIERETRLTPIRIPFLGA